MPLRASLVRAAVFVVALSASRAFAVETLSLPLTADGLDAFLAGQAEPTLPGLLDALPASLQENFVLVHTSRSMQRATTATPRQVMFGSDARFLLAVGSVPEDPRFDEAEFAEFDPATGLYHYGTISFVAGARPTVRRNVAFCQNCHGTPARPIWGEYPTWSGVYGDEHGAVAAATKADFQAFLAAAPTAPHYRHLRFAPDASGATFLLPTRYYPYPNTDFNHELGNTVALGTLTRIQRHGDLRRWGAAALATNSTLDCIGADAWPDVVRRVNAAYSAIQANYPATTRSDVKAMRLAGVEPLTELSLDQFGATPGRGPVWQTGAYRLEEAIAFQLVVALSAEDSALKALFAPEQATIDGIERRALLVGAERAAALERSSSWFLFFEVFDPLVADRERHEAVCANLLHHLSDDF